MGLVCGPLKKMAKYLEKMPILTILPPFSNWVLCRSLTKINHNSSDYREDQ